MYSREPNCRDETRNGEDEKMRELRIAKI